MISNIEVVNTRAVPKIPLKKLISDCFTKENGKQFFSIEVTPKSGLKIDFGSLKTLPLFVDITWLGDGNIQSPIENTPAFDLAAKIESSQVVNSLTCYKMSDETLDQILQIPGSSKNFTLLRGDLVDPNQRFKFANELIAEVRRKTSSAPAHDSITIFAGGYPEAHAESKSQDEDLNNLKRKVDAGVDVILTQVVFSAEKFIKFVEKCRECGISSDIQIIPGLYIPRDFIELQLMIKITSATMDDAILEKFIKLKDDKNEFQNLSLDFTLKIMKKINEEASEHIRGFHFFTMNHFEMVKKVVENFEFSEGGYFDI